MFGQLSNKHTNSLVWVDGLPNPRLAPTALRHLRPHPAPAPALVGHSGVTKVADHEEEVEAAGEDFEQDGEDEQEGDPGEP